MQPGRTFWEEGFVGRLHYSTLGLHRRRSGKPKKLQEIALSLRPANIHGQFAQRFSAVICYRDAVPRGLPRFLAAAET
jgi:hypothetical protein